MLSCDHQCPSLCGEVCPSPRFCQTCAPDNIKNSPVDYILGETYAELDLNTSPVLVPSCGHVMTVESFDGLMEMNNHYEFAPNGSITGLTAKLKPFSAGGLKNCPMCRSPLRNIARYNRIVKRGLIDVATKKFIVWANSQFVSLETNLYTYEKQLHEDRSAPQGPSVTTLRNGSAGIESITKNAVGQELRLEGSRDQQFASICDLSGLGWRYSDIVKLRKEISMHLKSVDLVEQPFGRVREMVENARRRYNVTMANLDDGSSILQFRNRLLAKMLSLRCDFAILSSFVQVYTQHKKSNFATPAMIAPYQWLGAALKLDFRQNLDECEEVCEEAIAQDQPMQIIEAHLFYASFVVLQRSAPADADQTKILTTKAKEHVEAARLVCQRAPSTVSMLSEIDAVEKMLREETFYEMVTNEEKRAIYAAMALEFRGTGHWYYCENGHPFTIGECGMPMEIARCPQCGASVGGQGHQAVEGVRRAVDLEEQFGQMGIEGDE